MPIQVVASPPVEQYRQAEWWPFEASPYFTAERMAILEAKPLQRIFEGKEPWYRAICGVAWSMARGGSMLDLGCGLGQQYEAIQQWAPEMHYAGADAVDRCLEVCRRRQPKVGWHRVSYPDCGEIGDGAYDVVLLRSILRHWFPEHGYRLIRAAWRIARKAIILGFWSEWVPGDPVARPDGKGSYFVEWPLSAVEEIRALGDTTRVGVIHQPAPRWPARRLVVVGK